MRKDRVDLFGAVALVGFSALLGLNQVIIKLVNEGFQPVFFAGLRSLGAVGCLWLWMGLRGRPLGLNRDLAGPGLFVGMLFAGEFICLFVALDLTTVARTSVIFYTMPVWLAIGAHFLLPGEGLTPVKAAGLALAFAGVAWAILDRPAGVGEASLTGDLLALLGAFGWAGIALAARATRLREAPPETQLFWQVLVSAPILLLAAPLFGPLIRDLAPIHFAGLGVQIVVIATAGFVFWFWLLSIYPAASVAAFGFLAPVFGVFFGWLFLGETVGPSLLGALGLVVAGLVLINRPARVQVPQKV